MGLKSKKEAGPNPYPDSAATATAICSGVKTYNGSINVGPTGERVSTVAHEVQQDGWLVGAVSSVPISHATPASTYGHNVHRSDYQDITRDLLGLPSISHPDAPLTGLDVLIGAGYGAERDEDRSQGENYVPGNRYLADKDLEAIDVTNGGKYRTVLPTPGVDGRHRIAGSRPTGGSERPAAVRLLRHRPVRAPSISDGRRRLPACPGTQRQGRIVLR